LSVALAAITHLIGASGREYLCILTVLQDQ
jgi:hypothetical protein